MCLKDGRFEESYRYFNKLNQMFPDSPEVAYNLAEMYVHCMVMVMISELSRGRTDSAIKYLLLHTTLVPNDARALLRLGEVYRDLNDVDQAMHYYLEVR